jgi:cytochrome P450
MREWMETIPNDGLIKYNHLMNSERVLPTTPKALAEVLVTKNYTFIKPPFFRENLGRLLGNGILFSEGDEHKRQRRNLMPAFGFRHIKDLYPIFWSKGRQVTQVMTKVLQGEKSEHPDGAVIDAASWASRVTLDIIGVAGMGHDFNAVNDENTELNRTYRLVFQPSGDARFIQRLGIIIPPSILNKLPFRRNIEVQAARKIIRRICLELVEEKKEKLKKGITAKDILSVAIESGGFDDEDLVNQLMTFLAAGHETTASAMQWACYWLCKYSDVQTKLREEIRANLPSPEDNDAIISNTDIEKLPYLNAVCNEILRFSPSVPLTVRTAAHDTTIQGHAIPKGTFVILVPWAVNVSRELWGEDAGEFNPERWVGTGRAHPGGAESNYSFLTFLHGPRSCIGQKFAQAEFMCLLAAWVGRFEISFEKNDYVLEIVGGATSKPKNMKLRMKVIEGW